MMIARAVKMRMAAYVVLACLAWGCSTSALADGGLLFGGGSGQGKTGTACEDCAFSPSEKSLLASVSALADWHVGSVLRSLNLLALTDEVKSGDWEAMKALVSAFQKDNPDLLAFYIKPDGGYYTAEMGLTGKSLGDRDYFPGLMAGGDVAGAVVVGKTSGKKSVIVGAPVFDGEAVTGALGAALYAGDMSQALARSLALPENMFFSAVTEKGEVAVTNRENLLLEPCVKDPDVPAPLDYIKQNSGGIMPFLASGKKGCLVFQTSPLTSWRVVLGIIKP